VRSLWNRHHGRNRDVASHDQRKRRHLRHKRVYSQFKKNASANPRRRLTAVGFYRKRKTRSGPAA
jgi:hypothetical protein